MTLGLILLWASTAAVSAAAGLIAGEVWAVAMGCRPAPRPDRGPEPDEAATHLHDPYSTRVPFTEEPDHVS